MHLVITTVEDLMKLRGWRLVCDLHAVLNVHTLSIAPYCVEFKYFLHHPPASLRIVNYCSEQAAVNIKTSVFKYHRVRFGHVKLFTTNFWHLTVILDYAIIYI